MVLVGKGLPGIKTARRRELGGVLRSVVLFLRGTRTKRVNRTSDVEESGECLANQGRQVVKVSGVTRWQDKV